jgi:hypothetical protein
VTTSSDSLHMRCPPRRKRHLDCTPCYMPERTETIEGFVVDIACLRKYPRSEWNERAHGHTRTCALMGHCVESRSWWTHSSGARVTPAYAYEWCATWRTARCVRDQLMRSADGGSSLWRSVVSSAPLTRPGRRHRAPTRRATPLSESAPSRQPVGTRRRYGCQPVRAR